MKESLTRFGIIIGETAIEKLQQSKVAIFGLGGVGSYVAESLARGGVGSFLLVDKDEVEITNINRQLCATFDTIGRAKTDIVTQRILSINPDAEIQGRKEFFLPDNANSFDFSDCDYIVDAIDTVTAKIALIKKAKEENKEIISAMGAGNRLDITALKVDDIYSTDVCPLCRVMRKELRNIGIKDLKVVYSTEKAITPTLDERENGKQIVGSSPWLPSAMGLIISAEVMTALTKK